MSDPGYVAVHRSIWDHDVFEPAPFSEREAWLWLVSSAAWKPTKVRVGYKMLSLERGDLSFSERFLAEKWQWSKTKVHRFLALLESENMITRNSDQGLNQITICNYDKYQAPWTSQRTESGPEADQKRTKEEELNNTITDDAVAPRGALVTPEAIKLTEKLLVICGHDPKFWPPGWVGAPMRVQAWLNQGWDPAIIVVAVQKVVAKARGRPINSVKFFENAIAEEIARQSEPLPIVEIREADKLTVTKNAKAGGYDEAYDRVLAKLNAGFAGGLPEERVCPEPGEAHARLLPYRRSQ